MEKAPDIHTEYLQEGQIVVPVFKQGEFEAFQFTGWSITAYPVGAAQPKQHDTVMTGFDRQVTRF